MPLRAIICCYLMSVAAAPSPEEPYAMYVWRDGWDSTLFLNWSRSDTCFTHTWNTPTKRQWLWDTCNRQDRPIDQLFFYDTDFLSNRDCNSPDAQYLRETLREGRTDVPGLQIYALYSLGGEDVPESNSIPHVVWYNEQCAQSDDEKFDGVAVNNEDYSRYWPESEMVTFLDNLYKIKQEATKQSPPGSLKCHFSVSYNWGLDNDGNDIKITWMGLRQPVMRHFIDIFDSLDVQVAYTLSFIMKDRLLGTEWNYAQQQGKSLLPTIYLDKTEPPQTTFFPCLEGATGCSHADKTEAAMWRELDALQEALPGVKPVLHHFRGPYSSGGHPDWPKHG